MIDDSTETGTYMGGNFSTGYIRFDLGGRYSVTQLDIYNTSGDQIKGYRIFVTDSSVASTAVQASWGESVAQGTFLAQTGTQSVALTPKEGHYLILFVEPPHDFHVHPKEAWIYGDPVIDVSSFAVADASSTSTIITNDATVNVTAFDASSPAPETITNWLITEGHSDVPLLDDDRWLDAPPGTYSLLTADPGTGIDVTLYAWVKDSADRIASSRSISIYLCLADPVVANPAVTSTRLTMASVTWTTDINAFGFVKYRAVGASDWTFTALETAKTKTHSHVITGLTPGEQYEIVIQNNEKIEDAIILDHLPGYDVWGQDIDKSAWTATASRVASAEPGYQPPNAIDGKLTTSWYAGAAVGTQWLRIDMGARYDVRVVSFDQNQDLQWLEVYVTDSQSDAVADWGAYVARTTDKAQHQDLITTPKEGRFILLRVSFVHHCSIKEVSAMGLPVPTVSVDEFTVADQSSNNALWTDDATVAVTAFVADASGGVAGWMITETATEPLPDDEGWLAEAPAAYTITGGEGTVTLYAWVMDASGNVGGKSAAILFSTAAPVVSNIAVTAGAPGSGIATVTWNTTDVPAFPSVMFGVVSLVGATPNTALGTAVGTAHSVVLDGIADATNYKIIVVSNNKSEPAIYWPKPWPIDGDANGDCRVNILDLIFIRNKLNQPVGTGDNWKANVNQDANINILDLIFVRNKLNTSCP